MKVSIEIAKQPFIVEFDYKFTSRGCGATYWEPAEPAEWEIVGKLSLMTDDKKDIELEIPKWLDEILGTFIQEDEAVNEKMQEAGWEDQMDQPDYD